MLGPGELGQPAGGLVDAAHGVDDPHVVADAHVPVFPDVPLKGQPRLHRDHRPEIRMVGIFQHPVQIGFQIVAVDVLPLGNILGGVADGRAIFDDRLPGPDVPQRVFVPVFQIDLDVVQRMQDHSARPFPALSTAWVRNRRSCPQSSASPRISATLASFMNSMTLGPSLGVPFL